MKNETKDLLRSIGTNAAGTVIGAGIIAVIAFFAGKINLLVVYWKEVLLFLLLIFIGLTLVVWFRKLLRIEKELESVKKNSKFGGDTESIKKIRKDLIRITEAVSSGNTTPLKYMIVELEIENFRSNHQVGELSSLIKKLYMDIERGWNHDIRDTLMEIREYIKRSGMPYYYVEDLNKALKLVERDFSVLKKEIEDLSQEKLYKI